MTYSDASWKPFVNDAIYAVCEFLVDHLRLIEEVRQIMGNGLLSEKENSEIQALEKILQRLDKSEKIDFGKMTWEARVRKAAEKLRDKGQDGNANSIEDFLGTIPNPHETESGVREKAQREAARFILNILCVSLRISKN
jgi:hypothetical protein